MPHDASDLGGFAARQHGAVTRQQARGCGLSNSAISRRVASGRWVAVHRGVLVTDPPPTWRGRISAARLFVGDGARPAGVVAGWAAAALWGFADLPADERIELLLPRGIRRGQVHGLRLRWAPLSPAETALRSDVSCTSPLRTLRDLLPRIDRTAGVVLCDSALRAGVVGPDDLAQLAGPRGWRRVPSQARVGSESVFETLVRLELLDAGLPEPDLQHRVREGDRVIARVDFAWPRLKLAVEADGASVHANAAALRSDLRRQNALVAAGWTVLRFTWADLGRISSVVAARLGS